MIEQAGSAGKDKGDQGLGALGVGPSWLGLLGEQTQPSSKNRTAVVERHSR